VKVEALEGSCIRIQVYLESIYTECDDQTSRSGRKSTVYRLYCNLCDMDTGPSAPFSTFDRRAVNIRKPRSFCWL
jgi:hypothetical protein